MVKINNKRRAKGKDLEIRKAMATAYVSSPYLSKKRKKKLAQSLFN